MFNERSGSRRCTGSEFQSITYSGSTNHKWSTRNTGDPQKEALILIQTWSHYFEVKSFYINSLFYPEGTLKEVHQTHPFWTISLIFRILHVFSSCLSDWAALIYFYLVHSFKISFPFLVNIFTFNLIKGQLDWVLISRPLKLMPMSTKSESYV